MKARKKSFLGAYLEWQLAQAKRLAPKPKPLLGPLVAPRKKRAITDDEHGNT